MSKTLNIYIGTNEDDIKKDVPETYHTYYPANDIIEYTIYRKSQKYFIIQAEKAPYAIVCTLAKNNDMFYFKEKYDSKIPSNLPSVVVQAFNCKGLQTYPFVLTADDLETLKLPSNEEVNAGISFLNDKHLLLRMLIKKRGFSYTKFEELETKEEPVSKSKLEADENDIENKEYKKEPETQKVIYYRFELGSEESYVKRIKQLLSKRKLIDFISFFDKKSIDICKLETKNDNSSNYVTFKMSFHTYDEDKNILIVKRYPELEVNNNKKKEEIPTEGYIAPSIFQDLSQVNRQKRNCRDFKDGNFPLKDYFLEPKSLHSSENIDESTISFYNKNLTDDQKKAVSKSLENSPILLINGPPGTGKTTVITEIIAQLNKQNKTVWLSSQTNLAIDNALERLPKNTLCRPKRIGREEKINDKRFCNGLEVAHYFKYQYYDGLQETVKKYEVNKAKCDNFRSIIVKLQKRDELQNTINEMRKGIKHSENNETVKSFINWLEKPELDFFPNIGKDLLRDLCFKLDTTCSFLTDYERDDFFWKVGPKEQNEILNERLESLYSAMLINNDKRAAFNAFVNEKKSALSNETTTQDDIKQKESELTKIKSVIDNFIREKNETENTIENAYDVCQNVLNDISEEKYLFYKDLLKLETFTEANKEQKERYVGIEYAPNILGATCNINPKELKVNNKDVLYDVVIIDEVSKLTWIEMILPVMKAKQLILVGDHHQLPPVFKEGKDVEQFADIAEELDIEFEELKKKVKSYEKVVVNSKFQTLWNAVPDSAKVGLTTQFRCHPDIMNFFNVFYRADKSIGGLTCGLKNPDVERKHELQPIWNKEAKHLVWIDSSSTTKKESRDEGKTSVYNMYEVHIIEKALEDLYLEAKKRNIKKEVGVITFYGAQVGKLKRKLQESCKKYKSHLDIEINTVDDFQGKEKDLVLVSLVRNPSKKGGLRYNNFVKEYRRINVAFSRAKELLVVVGARDVFSEVQVPISGAKLALYKALIEDNAKNITLLKASDVIGN